MNAGHGSSEGLVRRPVTRVTGRSRERIEDAIAVERALEIRVDGRALRSSSWAVATRRAQRSACS